jgi:glyoxylase-like metal-dependent hydrolase (beta-lactamase superfamily II)
MIQVKTFHFNPFYENTYVVWDEETKESAIIDPGCYGEKEEKALGNFIETAGLNIKYLFNTHCHIDHVLGNNFVINKYNPEFYLPEGDLHLLKNIQIQGDLYGIRIEEPILSDKFLNEKLKLKIGGTVIEFLLTPGHSPGEFCILLRDEKICFSGDVLFYESIGRTDLWGGNYNQIIDSIKTKLFTLEDEVVIYPGHGETPTIKHEKENNPFFM